MKEFTVPMALFDFFPVIFFTLGMSRMVRFLRNKMNPLTMVLCYGGTFLVAAAGALKALYKLLYASGAGDFSWMSAQFFSNQALGFVFLGFGLTLVVLKKVRDKAFALIPVMGLVGLMVIGTGAMNASLAYLASKMKKKGAMICFIVSFFLILGMGYLSSKDFGKASMNWIAQCVNFFGQLLLMYGCFMVTKEK